MSIITRGDWGGGGEEKGVISIRLTWLEHGIIIAYTFFLWLCASGEPVADTVKGDVIWPADGKYPLIVDTTRDACFGLFQENIIRGRHARSVFAK